MNIRIITLAIVTLLVQNAWAQNTFKAIVKDGKNKEILIGVNAVLNKTTNGASSDENGIITISNIPNGVQHITFSYLGYESETKSFSFPLSSTAPVEIFLEQDEEILEEVIISSTRGTRSIQNIPTRVEFITVLSMETKTRRPAAMWRWRTVILTGLCRTSAQTIPEEKERQECPRSWRTSAIRKRGNYYVNISDGN